MNAPLRRVGIVVLVLFGLLFLNLNWVQAYKSDDYRTSRYNGRVQLSDYQRQRGVIADATGAPLATSVATTDSLKYLRSYPNGPAFAPVTGYRPVNLAAIGVENAENDFLSGNTDAQIGDRLADLFSDSQRPGGNVFLTINKKVQLAAYNGLIHNGVGVKTGAAVAIDPATGKILALASFPSYDPNTLTTHDTPDAFDAFNKLDQDADNPLLDRGISETYPPGSTFKVIVSAAALSTGAYAPTTLIPAGPFYTPVSGGGYTMKNDVPSICPQAQVTLISALTQSCNTGYAQLGVKLGSAAVKAQAQAFGFEDDALTIAGTGNGAMGVAASHTGTMLTPSGNDDANHVAQSSIGQFEVRMTPLMGAMIAAAVANGGVEMRPYLIDKLQSPDLTTTYTTQPSVLRTPITGPVATQLQQMMISVVQNGTGRRAQISGYDVGGKTGTAENATGGENHGWFIGFAMKDGKPIAAVAVLLANAGDIGSRTATEIGGAILKAAIAAQGSK